MNRKTMANPTVQPKTGEREKRASLLLDLCVAADVCLIGLFALAPIWWEYPALWVLGKFILWVLAIFAFITALRWCVWMAGKRKNRVTIKYDAKGRRTDSAHLGYISGETICEICKMNREGK